VLQSDSPMENSTSVSESLSQPASFEPHRAVDVLTHSNFFRTWLIMLLYLWAMEYVFDTWFSGFAGMCSICELTCPGIGVGIGVVMGRHNLRSILVSENQTSDSRSIEDRLCSMS